MNTWYLAILAVPVALDTASANDTWIVREDVAGPVRIGMRLPELNAMPHYTTRRTLPETNLRSHGVLALPQHTSFFARLFV